VSELRLILRQARWALLIVLRVREAIVFTIVFPVLLLVLFNTIFGGQAAELSGGGELSTEAYYTAAMIAYAVMSAAFTTLALSLVEQRESGQLKRLRGTPLPPWAFVAAQVLRVVVVSAATVAALLAIGVFAFGVEVDAPTLARVALYAALGTATMAVLGMALTAIARSSDTASTLAPFIASSSRSSQVCSCRPRSCPTGLQRSAPCSRSSRSPTACNARCSTRARWRWGTCSRSRRGPRSAWSSPRAASAGNRRRPSRFAD
jgi:ABC-type multidrug transport system permease subunit